MCDFSLCSDSVCHKTSPAGHPNGRPWFVGLCLVMNLVMQNQVALHVEHETAGLALMGLVNNELDFVFIDLVVKIFMTSHHQARFERLAAESTIVQELLVGHLMVQPIFVSDEHSTALLT